MTNEPSRRDGPIRTVQSRTGAVMPAIGQGTWEMGVKAARGREEADALRLGLDLGMTLIDTAEMYGEGGAEEVVGKAILGRRDGIFLVSKVLPQNASPEGTVLAAERSLKRLRTDRIDLYLLHWPGSHPVEETLEGFRSLREAGKILHYGLSNFDTAGMAGAAAMAGGEILAANQVLYNLRRRGIERNLLPWCAERGIVIMAYSPLDQGKLLSGPVLDRIAKRRGVAPTTVAVAWTMRRDGVVTIPKSSRPEHVRQNAAAASLVLTAEDLAELDAAFPAPRHDIPLETA
jgi:diketogulonate reductase-like aldo/keto reductase